MIAVLYVDDEAHLLDVAKIFLERTGDFSVETTTSAEDALRILQHRPFDAIISDYQMPEMDGIRFLQQVRSELGPLPFILFTGKGREEVVIQALNEGADFYIQKGGEPKAQFIELAHKIRQAVSRQQAEEALKKSKQHYRNLIRSASEAIYVIQDGILRMTNPKLAELTGYTEEELVSVSITAMIHPDDRAMVLEHFGRRLRGGVVPRYSFRLYRKDRSICWVDAGGILISWDRHPAVMVFLTDISERKRAEETLQESEEKYRLVVENSHDAIYIHMDNRLWFVNRGAAQVTGYTPEELLKVNLWDLVHPDDRARLQESAKRRIAGEEVSPFFTARLITKSGEIRQGDFFVDLIDYHGRPAILGIYRDLTEQRRTEISLRESEEKYRILLHESPDPVFSFYPDGTYRYVNKAFADGVGRTVDQIVGKKIWDVFDKDEADKRFLPLSRAFATGNQDVIEVRVPRPDGDRYYLTTITPVKDEAGAVISCICSSKEITGRKKMEVSLRESEEKYRILLHESPDPAFSIDQNGTYRYVNRAFAEMTGLSAGEIIGRKVLDILPPEDAQQRYAGIRRVFETGTGGSIEGRVPRPEGDRYFLTTITPIKDSTGAVISCIGSAKDITDRKRAEDALRRANRHLGLLTDITRHDISNQVSALKGYLELTKAMLGDRQKIAEFIEKKEQAAAAIERQIAFMTRYQDIGTGEPAWQDVEEAVLRARTLLPAEGIRFETSIRGIEVYADPLIDRVFSNLLDNALRHGEHVTEIRVSFRHEDTNLVIIWEDNGVGIAAGDKEQIFVRGFGKHTGFGMFLAREILSLTEITIRETGEPGKGAHFEITVPGGAYRSVPPQQDAAEQP